MRPFIIFLFSFLMVNASARVMTAQVQDLDIGDGKTEVILIFLSNGQVVLLPWHQTEFLNALQKANRDKLWVKVTLNDEREVINFEWAVAGQGLKENLHEKTLEHFTPTILSSMEVAQKVFKEARYKNIVSQCFNRAHVWAYEWKKKRDLNSGKMFVFFTRKYIRENNFHWWFHVAPFVHVAVGENIKERVLDMKFMNGPKTVGDWVKGLLKKDVQCVTVNKYSDYANYPESNDCYLMRASMYYYWPLDLENEELYGTKKQSWSKAELSIAYDEAFNLNF